MGIGEIIRKNREKAGFTREEVAQKLQLPVQAIAIFEDGGSELSFGESILMSYMFGMSDSDFKKVKDFYHFYNVREKVEKGKRDFLVQCLASAHEINEVCSTLDEWDEEGQEINGAEEVILVKRGVKIKDGIISLDQADPLNIHNAIVEAKRKGLDGMIEKYGETVVSRAAILLSVGRDVALHTWDLPTENDPGYRKSVCDLLAIDREEFSGDQYPYHRVLDFNPAVAAEYIRLGLATIVKAA